MNSYNIINDFNNIYIQELRKNDFTVLVPRSENFPKWSFYDAVHYTDIGSEHMARYYKIKLLKLIK